MSENIFTFSKFEEFQSYLSDITLDLDILKDFEYFYRGCSVHDWEYNLTPGIYRDNRILKEEINFKEMILRNPNDFLNDSTTLEKLVKMQHYRLPTRLLDITSNPLVALYFACKPFKDVISHGKVYVFKIPKEDIKYYDSDAVALISNLAKLRIHKTNFNADGFDFLKHEVREEKPYYLDGFDNENERDITTVFPVKVKLNNNRIVKQSGAFLIFGMNDLEDKTHQAQFPTNFLFNEILIDETAKARILSILNSFAINDYTLFPELEYAADYLDNQ